MVQRVKATNIRNASQEPVSHSASRDSCCPGDCGCSVNYGCQCDHDCTCPDRSLSGTEHHDLVLSHEYLAKLYGGEGAASQFPRTESGVSRAVHVSDDELYDAGDMELVKDTMLGDNPSHGSLYKAAPGPPPRPGLEWKEETHRWIRPTADAAKSWRDLTPTEWMSAARTLPLEDLYTALGEMNGAGDTFYLTRQLILHRASDEFESEVVGKDLEWLQAVKEELEEKLAEVRDDKALTYEGGALGDRNILNVKAKVYANDIDTLEREISNAQLQDPARYQKLAAAARAIGLSLNSTESEKVESATDKRLGSKALTASTGQREDVKHTLVTHITAHILNQVAQDPTLEGELRERNPNVAYGFKPLKESVYDTVNTLIHHWAESSADNHVVSLAMQQAARDEFGVEDATMSHNMRTAGETYFEAQRLAQGPKGKIYRAFHRAQYDITQRWLKDNGIEHLTLYRGASLPSKQVTDSIGDESVGVTKVNTQPISSFSYDLRTAEMFAPDGDEDKTSTVSAVRIPAARVLSTSLTGYGCLTEGEVTVLGGNDPALLFNRDALIDNEAHEFFAMSVPGLMHAYITGLERELKDADD